MKFMTLSVMSRLNLFPGATFELRSLAEGLKFLRPSKGNDNHALLVSNDLLAHPFTSLIPQTIGGRNTEVTLHSASIANFYGARMAIPPVINQRESFLIWIPSDLANVTKIGNDAPHFSNGVIMEGLYILAPKQEMMVHVAGKSANAFDVTVKHDGRELLVNGKAMDSTVIFE